MFFSSTLIQGHEVASFRTALGLLAYQASGTWVNCILTQSGSTQSVCKLIVLDTAGEAEMNS